jgi:hypothetical protein
MTLQLDDPLEVRVLHSSVSAYGLSAGNPVQFTEAVDALGDIGGLAIEDSLIEAFGSNETAVGIGSASTNAAGVELRRNRVHVEGHGSLTGMSLIGGGAIVDSNEVECVGDGLGLAVGIQCDGFGEAASCARVVGNEVSGPVCSGTCAYDSAALVVTGGTLVDSNRLEGGCSHGASWSQAVGLRAGGDVRVQNNVLTGATCPGAGQGLQGYGVVIDAKTGSVDLHSNYVDGGVASAGGCSTAGIEIRGGSSLVRNNIIAPGSCAKSFNVDQGQGAALPEALENNDFAPGVSSTELYRIIGATDPRSIEQVNALPGSGGNFSAPCGYPLEVGSACNNAGTPEGAPELDIDAETRNETAPDVGPDEVAEGPTLSCVHVTLDGDDASAIASQGTLPFRNVQPAIDFADTHRGFVTSVCVAAGTSCQASATYEGPASAPLEMREGIAVLGKYESTDWTRCTDPSSSTITRLIPNTASGVVFGPEITRETRLDGFEITSAFALDTTTAVTVDGARGAILSDVSMPDRTSWEPNSGMPEYSYGVLALAGSEVTVEGDSHIHAPPASENVRGVISFGGSVDIRDSRVVAFGPVDTVGIAIHDGPEARVVNTLIIANGMSGDEPLGFLAGVITGGDFNQLLLDLNQVIVHAQRQRAVGMIVDSGLQTGAFATRNQVSVVGNGDVTGIESSGGGGLVVRSNDVSIIGNGGGHAIGLFCGAQFTHAGASSCTLVSDNVVGGFFGDESCGAACGYEAVGMWVTSSLETLVDSNRVEAVCGADDTTGVRAQGNVRLQNNVVTAGACAAEGGSSVGLSIEQLSAAGPVDAHSNWLDPGFSGSNCVSTGVVVAAEGSVLRNNIILPGSCTTAFNVNQLLPSAAPAAFENNDLVPGGSVLYYRNTQSDADTIEEVNALPGSSNNFSAPCAFPLELGSACVDAGTLAGSPDHDFDAEVRNDGAPDVGPDELLATSCTGQEPVQTLVPSDGGPTDTRRLSVAISGDHALLAPVSLNNQAGAVYAYARTAGAWAEQQKIIPPDSSAPDGFGLGVALQGETAVIGAPFKGAPNGFGAGYVYRREASAWTFVQELLLPDPRSGDTLGFSTALDSDTLALGSTRGPYVYRRSGSVWILEQALPAPYPAGMSVALDGDTLLAGYDCDAFGVQGCRGLAIVYTRIGATWSEQQRLVASDGQREDRFGNAVALAGDTAFVGAPGRSSRQGAVYVFERSGAIWTERQTLELRPGPNFSAEFGQSVAAVDGWLLAARAGAGLSYRPSAGMWLLETSLVPEVTGEPALGAVALSGTTALVGVTAGTLGNQLSSGSVFGPCASP